jgi:hypothetical protein
MNKCYSYKRFAFLKRKYEVIKTVTKRQVTSNILRA